MANLPNDIQEIRCHCGTLFGIRQPNGTLTIKARDVYRTIDGVVTGPCRRCGATVRWPLTIEKGG